MATKCDDRIPYNITESLVQLGPGGACDREYQWILVSLNTFGDPYPGRMLQWMSSRMFVPRSTSTGEDQHCGSPGSEVKPYGELSMATLEFFVGVDWGSQDHQVCVLDRAGKRYGQRRFEHSGSGLMQMVDWILETTHSEPRSVAVAIETPHGPVVECLVVRELKVYSINPKQLDRFRDRFSLAGAKDDRLDAHVLAESVRSDRHQLRLLGTHANEVVQLREYTRLRGQLCQDKVRLSNQMHQVLWRYYPQFLKVYGDLSHPWVLALWQLAPTPQQAKRLRMGSIARLLKTHRIRCVDAKTVKQCLTATSVTVSAGTTQGAVFQLKSVIERLTVVNRQIKETHREIDRLIHEYDQALREDDDPEALMRQRDVEILSSIPGVGTIVLATLLAEASDLLCLRDYNALRAFGGVAPVTKRSGTLYRVVRRMAVNPRLQQALYHWARTASQFDPVSKAKYTTLRARGHGHARALRSVADRLLKVACVMLTHQREFDREYPRYELAA